MEVINLILDLCCLETTSSYCPVWTRTFLPQQKVQEVVGVGHAYFSLHLRTSEGGIDLPGTPLLCPPQFRQPTAHPPERGEGMGGGEGGRVDR